MTTTTPGRGITAPAQRRQPGRVPAVITGTLDAVEVRDGSFRAQLRADRTGEIIDIRFPGHLAATVRAGLCHRVTVHGQLHYHRDTARNALHLDALTITD